MNNEGDFLEFANDMKEQYNDMKESYELKISLLNQEVSYLKQELKRSPQLVFLDNQFLSTRPPAKTPTYVNY